MPENSVENFGWTSAQRTCSTSYIAPRILRILEEIGAKRIADIGAGNGALCGELASAGYEIIGVEYDKQGVDIARAAYPLINFYTFLVSRIIPKGCWSLRGNLMR